MPTESDRQRNRDYQATLTLSFKYVGQRHQAITTEVSPRAISVVAPVRLPVGAILVFQVDESKTTPHANGIHLIAQVARVGPASFGGPDDWSARLDLLRVTGGSWQALIRFFRHRLHAQSTSVFRDADPEASQPTIDLRATSGGERSDFEALFCVEGVWFRGEIVTANLSTVWVRTARSAPSVGAAIRIRVAVRDGEELASVDISGRVPGDALPDQHSRGWIFEIEIDQINHTGFYGRLLTLLRQSEDPV